MSMLIQAGFGDKSWIVHELGGKLELTTPKMHVELTCNKIAAIRLAKRLRNNALPALSRWTS